MQTLTALAYRPLAALLSSDPLSDYSIAKLEHEQLTDELRHYVSSNKTYQEMNAYQDMMFTRLASAYPDRPTEELSSWARKDATRKFATELNELATKTDELHRKIADAYRHMKSVECTPAFYAGCS